MRGRGPTPLAGWPDLGGRGRHCVDRGGIGLRACSIAASGRGHDRRSVRGAVGSVRHRDIRGELGSGAGLSLRRQAGLVRGLREIAHMEAPGAIDLWQCSAFGALGRRAFDP